MKRKTYPWKKISVLIALFFFSIITYGQRIQKDIFDNLVFQDNQYEAKLQKNILDDLIFTDSNGNTIEFNKLYLEKKFGDKYNDFDVKSLFFQDLAFDYMHISGYEASYKVDLLGEVTVANNQGKITKAKEDIFGNLKIETTNKKRQSQIQKNLQGELEYSSGQQFAKLVKNLRGEQVYTDSNKTRIELQTTVWEQLLRRYKTEYEVFNFLLEEFLIINP